jgi:ABC-type spermidine/putrescine transport system permease subunit I
MFGNEIADLFNASLDWQTGSVLALFLLGVVALLMVVFVRFLQVRRVAAS